MSVSSSASGIRKTASGCSMVKVLRVLLMAAALIGCTRPAAPAGPRVPVVVELFTSDGCSSCPPADRLFSGLVQNQPIPTAQVIALGFHVDYWDQLGWKDPASLPLATARQQAYGRVWGPDRVYTPQAVVDGGAEVVGSDEHALVRAVERAASAPHASVAETLSNDGPDAIGVTVTVRAAAGGPAEPLDGQLFITEDGLTSNVQRGENAGRTLHHDAVVRAMYPLAGSPGGGLHARAVLKPEWRRPELHAVAVLQGRTTHRIWGAASTPIR